MKIFSLRSKWGLVAWSLALGFLLDRLLFQIKFVKCGYDGPACITHRGYPISYYMSASEFDPLYRNGMLLNIAIWIIIVFIILSLIKHFKNKN